MRVAGANVFAQGISLLLSPVLTRIYAPHEFGEFGIFVALSSLLAIACSARGDWIIGTLNSGRQAAALLSVLLAYSASTCLLAELGIWLWGNYSGAPARCKLLGSCAAPYYVPVAAFGLAASTLLGALAVRTGDLRPVSRSRVVQAATTATANIAGGLAGWGVLGLTVGWIGGVIAGLSTLLMVFHPHRAAPHLAHLAAAIRRHTLRTLVSGITAVINALGLYLPTILLGSLYSTTDAGLFVIAQRIALTPLQAVTSAVSMAFIAELKVAMMGPRGRVDAVFGKATRKLALFGIAAVVACAIAPLYMEPVFGVEWRAAGFLMPLLIPLVIGQAVVSPTAPLLTVLGHQTWVLVWDVTRTALVAVALIVPSHFSGGLNISVASYSGVMFVTYALLYFKMCRAARHHAAGATVARPA